MGYEGPLFIGTAGGTAATPVLNATDADYDVAQEMGSTAKRGTGATPPIESERPTSYKPEVTFKMLNEDGDTELALLLAASRPGGSPLALVFLDRAAGRGFDGDVNVKAKLNSPLKGEQTYEFTCTSNDCLREPDCDYNP